jgi:hypothetical protein
MIVYNLEFTFTKSKFAWRRGSVINSKDKCITMLGLDNLYILKETLNNFDFKFTEKEINKLITYIKEN